MKSALTLIACSCIATTVFSQQYTGYAYDNYAGTQSVVFNPAMVAGSKYKVDINLASVSFLAGNNAWELDKKKMFRFDLSGLREGTHYFKSANTDNKKLWMNTDILGPSFMMSIGAKNGIALTTRLRTVANEYNLSNNTFQFFNSDGGLFDTDINEENVQLKAHAFAEAGLTFGRIIYQNETHVLKAGVTGKYILGAGVGSFYSRNMLININPAKDFNALTGDVNAKYSSNIDALEDGDLSDIFSNAKSNGGWGVDVGFVYEWHPAGKKKDSAKTHWLQNDPTPYKLRISASLTDLGMVRYKNSPHGNSYLINAAGFNTDEFNKPDGESFDDYFNRLETLGILTPDSWEEKLKVKLPMAIRADVDYHIYKPFFINAGAVINMISKNDQLSAHYTTSFTVTPRFEKKWYSIYSPVYYNLEQEKIAWGAGFRAGPLFVGSASVLSNLISKDNISAMDVHVGLHIPIFKASNKKKEKKDQQAAKKEEKEEKKDEEQKDDQDDKSVKDTDGDGVTDDKDECPDVAGEIALIGCPDKDGDGVADHKDRCPDMAGSPKHDGCPVPDSDGDGVNDDVDNCPDLAGPVEYGGCPEHVKREVKDKVVSAARRIHFVTGQATIQKSAYQQLNAIVKILKSDPNLRLSIDGHTDNVGSDAFNDVLSVRRAQAVKTYLMSKGIAEYRLSAQGFGSSMPIDDNRTMAGRAKNRRVEMYLGYQ